MLASSNRVSKSTIGEGGAGFVLENERFRLGIVQQKSSSTACPAKCVADEEDRGVLGEFEASVRRVQRPV